MTVQLVIVIAHSVIHIHQRRCDVSIGGVGVVSGKLFRLLIRGRVLWNRRLLQPGDESGRRNQLDRALFRGWKENVERFDLGVEPKFLELG
ncbi:MAG TPA: hypothetical protein VF523_05895, partial [Burkholderiales bacterium]